MRVKPILFNTEMVKAILDGRKTVTRRVVKPHYKDNECGWQIIINADTHEFAYAEYYDELEASTRHMEPPYQPGDIMYVRESFCPNYFDESIAGYRGDGLRGNRNAYKADYRKDVVGDYVPEPKWTPSIHMPKEAARIWLKVTDVRVERLQDITEDDAAREFNLHPEAIKAVGKETLCKIAWNSSVRKSDLDRYGWEANPFVWVIVFERCEKPESEG